MTQVQLSPQFAPFIIKWVRALTRSDARGETRQHVAGQQHVLNILLETYKVINMNLKYKAQIKTIADYLLLICKNMLSFWKLDNLFLFFFLQKILDEGHINNGWCRKSYGVIYLIEWNKKLNRLWMSRSKYLLWGVVNYFRAFYSAMIKHLSTSSKVCLN